MNRDIKTGYDNTGGQIGLSLAESDSFEIPVPLHPVVVKDAPVSMPSAPAEAIRTFERRLVSALEHDYGDWMREANKAWHELYQVLSPHSQITERLFADLQDFIQYRPTWHPVETCRMALLLIREVQRELGIQGEDLDFHRFNLGWTQPETEMAFLEESSPFPDQRVPAYPPKQRSFEPWQDRSEI